MFTAILLVGLLAICILGALYGVDSRHNEPGRHRTNLL
jgi:hypothetical protein